MRDTRRGEVYESQTIREDGTAKFTSLYYPINFTTSDRFVFFSSLYEKPPMSVGFFTAQKATTMLYGSMRNPTRNYRGRTNTKLQSALEFLKNAAALEYAREQQFISYYTKKSPELQQYLYSIESTGNDKYLNLITKLNILLKGYDHYKIALEREMKRINDRREIKDIDETAKKAGRAVVQSKKYEKMTAEEYESRNNFNGDKSLYDTVTNPYFKADGKMMFNSLFSNRSNFSAIAKEIIIRYGAMLFEFKSGHLKLNARQTDAMLKVLVNKAYEMLILNYKDDLKHKTGETTMHYKKRIQQRLQEMLDEKEDFLNFMEGFINAPDLASSLDDIADQYGMPKYEDIRQYSKLEKVSIGPIKQRLKEAYKKEKQNWIDAGNSAKKFASFKTWRNEHGASDIDLQQMVYATQNIKAQAYYTNENMALAEFLSKGMSGVIAGGKNTPTDVSAGFLMIDLIDINTGRSTNYLADEEDEDIYKYAREAIEKSTKITNLESFKENTRRMKEARQQQAEKLEQIAKKINQDADVLTEMVNHINIHDTIKGYSSIDALNISKEFEGASFGSNLINQLDIINEMLSTGGINFADVNWLTFALINCGKGMIGSGNKNSLEDYLSAFVGMLMFTDAQLIVEDVKQFMEGNYTMSGVQDIHLYTLNTFYVPNSYILNETYKRLQAVILEIDDMIETHGTNVKIHTYNPTQTSGFTAEELLFPPGERWISEGESALQETYLEMTFMGGFLDFLEDLQAAIDF